jgi:hypothetical protein
MFITTDLNPMALEPRGRAMRWPGPRVLIIGPDPSDLSSQLEAAMQFYLVVDLAQRPSSRFDALRLAIARLARARVPMTGPLLYSVAGMSEKGIDRLEKAAGKDPWLVEYATDPADETLATLVIGERVVGNALFTTFFANLADGLDEDQTPGLIAEIEKHLVWREDAERS